MVRRSSRWWQYYVLLNSSFWGTARPRQLLLPPFALFTHSMCVPCFTVTLNNRRVTSLYSQYTHTALGADWERLSCWPIQCSFSCDWIIPRCHGHDNIMIIVPSILPQNIVLQHVTVKWSLSHRDQSLTITYAVQYKLCCIEAIVNIIAYWVQFSQTGCVA